MTTPPQTIRAQVGRFPLDIPVFGDKETTLQIVQKVNDRLRDVEGKSGRVDTMAFALRAAVEFAADLHRAKADHAEETKEILVALDAISDTLRAILDSVSGTE